MTGANSVVGLWRDLEREPQPAEDPGETLIAEEPQDFAVDEEYQGPLPGVLRRRLTLAAAILLSGLWLSLLGYERLFALGRLPAPSEWLEFISTASAPLALIAALWLVATRSGKGEERRFQRTSDAIQREAARLETLMAVVSTRLDESRSALAAQSETLLGLGDQASTRLSGIARGMEAEIESVSRYTQALTGSAAAARGDLAVLLANLPKADVQTRQMAASIGEAGRIAHERAEALEAQITLLSARGREAEESVRGAVEKLAGHLSRLDEMSGESSTRLEQATAQMTGTVEKTLHSMAEALDGARDGLQAHGEALLSLVEQSQAALGKTALASASELANRVGEIRSGIDAISDSLSSQDKLGQSLVTSLKESLEAIEQRFVQLESGGLGTAGRLDDAVRALAGHADEMKAALAGGDEQANALIERVQSLLSALQGAGREIDETLPQAYIRLESRANESISAVRAATPVVSELVDAASVALERLNSTDALLNQQTTHIASLAAQTDDQLTAARKAVEALQANIAQVIEDAARLAGEAVPQLAQSLEQVRETAHQASEEARTTLARVIPDSADALGKMSGEALSKALTAQVESQVSDVARATEQAVRSARLATEVLMQQVQSIAETSAALESRISDAKALAERDDSGSFARRVALLIEALNSTAIDVNKLLSNDVTDTAWASYLRGDRGIFTRRAVKLLKSGEVREIARHYENEPEFREQVSRYIHDFEAMLRNVLATRDGSSLGVTLLSSDNGKLYVALAQAIERFRS